MSDSTPRYVLGDDELSALTRTLISTQSIRPGEGRFLCYRVDSGSPLANIGRHIEREVFDEKFGNTVETMEAEYGPYDLPRRSTFFISVDRGRQTAAGVARMIHNSPAGLKTFNDLFIEGGPTSETLTLELFRAHHGVPDLGRCWDHATLAVRAPYRHGGTYAGLSVQLHRASYLSALEFGIDHVVSIVDARALAQIRDYLGVPFVPLCGTPSFRYLGSAQSQAVYGYYPEFYRKMTGWRQYTIKRLLARHTFRQLVQGSEDSSLMFTRSVTSDPSC